MRSFIGKRGIWSPFDLFGHLFKLLRGWCILAPGLNDSVALVALAVSGSLWLIPLSIAAGVSPPFYSRRNVSQYRRSELSSLIP